MANNENNYSERISFRLRTDQIEWVDKLAEEKGCRRSAILREIVNTHRAIMTSSLSQLLQGSPLDDVTMAVPRSEEDGSD